MPQLYWMPKRRTLERDIAEELSRIEELKAKRRETLFEEEAPTEAEPFAWQPPTWQPREQIAPPQIGEPTITPPQEWQPRAWAKPTEAPITTEPPMDYATLLGKPEYKEQPWYRTALEKATAPFVWLHEKVEIPGASFLTAPFSPELPWREGETWMEHEKREYEAWKAPKFVKGFAEFATSLPLFLIPYGGLSIAGSKFIGHAARVAGLARTAKVIEETGKILPAVERALAYPITKPIRMAGKGLTKAVTRPVGLEVAREGEKGITIGIVKLKPLRKLADEGFNIEHARRLTERWSKIPGLEWIVRKIDPSVLAYTPETRLTVTYARQLDIADSGIRALLMPEIMAMRNPKAIFGIDDLGFAKAVKPKMLTAPLDMDSIIRFPGKYNLTPEQLEYVSMHIKIWRPMRNALKEAGVLEHELANELGEGGYLGRIALGYTDKATGKTIKIRSGGRQIGAKQPLERPRKIESYDDAVEAGFRYETDPRVVLYARLSQGYKKLIDKEFIEEMAKEAGVRAIGTRALPERMARDIALRSAKDTEFILARLRRAVRGEKLTPQTLRAIRARNPDLADFLIGRTPPRMGLVGAKASEYEIEAIETEIGRISRALAIKGKLPKGVGTKPQLESQFAELQAKKEIAETVAFTSDTPELLPRYIQTALGDVESELGLRSVPYHGRVAGLFPELNSKQLDAMSKVYRDFLATVERGELRIKEITNLLKSIPTSREIKATIQRLNKQLIQDRKLAQKASTTAEKAIRIATGPTAREGTVFQAGMRQYMFPRQTAEYINRTLGPTGNAWVKTASDANAIIRFIQTGVDLGPYWLQGLPTFVTRPKTWAIAARHSMEGLFNERSFYAWLNQPAQRKTLEKIIPEGFALNLAEFVEAGPILAKIPGIGGFFNRWSHWFNFAIDGGRLCEAQALLAMPSIKSAGKDGVRAVVDHLGKKWGVMSTKWLGIPEGQRQLENAILFYSSRYTRSVLAMSKDILRGGMQGALARDMVGKMLFGMTVLYYGICKGLGQEPNLDPSVGKFMTVKIGTDNVGFGGSYIALVRLAGNTLRSLSENPEGFITLDSRDNPFVRFVRGRVAPLTGAGVDVITGRTFLGQPVDSLANFGKYVAIRNLTPFWFAGYAQGLVGAEPMPGPVAVLPEFLGMRVWPTQPWERREDLREHYAQADYGKSWAELRVLDRQKLEKAHADLKDITEEAWLQSIKRARPSRVAYSQWRTEHDQINKAYEETLWELQAEVDTGLKTPYDFRLSAQKFGMARRFALNQIDQKPEYEDVITALDEPRLEPEVLPQFEDTAFDIYMELMFSGDLQIGVDDYDFEEADKRRDWFISTYGMQTYNYVKERLSESKDYPPLMREYFKAVEAMRPYWQVRDEVIKLLGEPKTEWQRRRVNTYIQDRRRMLRRTNPDIAKYYMMFYVRPTL